MVDFAAGNGLDGIPVWILALWLLCWLVLLWGMARLVHYLRARRREPDRTP